jgi:transposase
MAVALLQCEDKHPMPSDHWRETAGVLSYSMGYPFSFMRMPLEGHPGLPPWRLALITILQFRENLTDRQAAEAVRARIDWKYLLGLE